MVTNFDSPCMEKGLLQLSVEDVLGGRLLSDGGMELRGFQEE